MYVCKEEPGDNLGAGGTGQRDQRTITKIAPARRALQMLRGGLALMPAGLKTAPPLPRRPPEPGCPPLQNKTPLRNAKFSLCTLHFPECTRSGVRRGTSSEGTPLAAHIVKRVQLRQRLLQPPTCNPDLRKLWVFGKRL